MADENITDEMRHAVARALYNEEDVKEMSCHPSTFEVIEALWPLIAKAAKAEAREACAKIADKHLARVPDHCPDREMEDLVAQGYGNAALNIAAAIRSMEVE